eukprot:m.496140 g.496140  ORF g.496140 m.496140 type:complete len:622 (+) comp21807_c0_seq1:148-2013(+)
MEINAMQDALRDDATEQIATARTNAENRQWTKAIEWFSEAIDTLQTGDLDEPDMWYDAYFGRGEAKFHQNDQNGAVKDFRTAADKAIQENSKQAVALSSAAAACESLGQVSDAKDLYLQAQRLCTSVKSPLWPNGQTLGHVLKNLDHRIKHGGSGGPETSTCATDATTSGNDKCTPVPANVLRAKEAGNAAYKVGQFGDALVQYTEAIDLMLACAEKSLLHVPLAGIYTNRALVALKDGQLRRCVEDCDEALKYDPASIKALHRRAMANEQREKYATAAIDFAAVLSVAPHETYARRGYDRVVNLARVLDSTFRPPPIRHVAMPMPTPHLASTTPKADPPSSEQAACSGSTVDTPSRAPPASSITRPSLSTPTPKSTSSTPPPTAVGTEVWLSGLKRNELNGQRGVVQGALSDKGRQVIRLDSGKEVALKPENFVTRDPAMAPERKNSDENDFIFVDPPTQRTADVTVPDAAPFRVPETTTPPDALVSKSGVDPSQTLRATAPTNVCVWEGKHTKAEGSPTTHQVTKSSEPSSTTGTEKPSENKKGASTAAVRDCGINPRDVSTMSSTTLAQLSKLQLIDLVLKMKVVQEQSEFEVQSLNRYITTLVEKAISTCPEILQSP